MRTDAPDAFVDRLKHVPGIVAIVVSGSQARGTAAPSSDTNLGLYYDRQSPLNVAALDAIATACDGPQMRRTDYRAWCMGPVDQRRRLASFGWAVGRPVVP